MKQSDYWKNRFTQLEASQNQKGLEYYATLEREFEKAAQKTDKELAAWYSRYATNEGIILDEAKRQLNTRELSEFRMSVDEYIKKGETLNYSDEWAVELERASVKFHVTRLEALKLQMQQQVETAYGYELDTFDGFIADQYTAGYYHTAFEVQKGLGVGIDMMKLDDKKIAKLITKPWATDGQNFSSRIWRDKSKLMNELPTILTQATIRGDGYAKTTKLLADRFNVSKSQAKNLVITESAFFSSASQTDCFNDLGVKQYEIIATLDGKTSPICRMMDGKVFDMKDRKSGITCAPFHGRCRSTSAPYFNDEFELNTKRAARDPDTGKTYHVPADMKYPDWEKSFVNGGGKDGLKVEVKGIKKVTSRAEAVEALTKDVGFDIVEDSVSLIDDALLIDNTNQLRILEDKFGVIHDSYGTITSTKAGVDTLAFVSPAKTNPLRQNLSLCPGAFKDKTTLIAKETSLMERKWSMPFSEDYASTFTVTHEYGHMLQHKIITDNMVKAGWSPDNPNQFLDLKKKTRKAITKWYDKIENATGKECFDGIMEIAKSNNPNFDLKSNISGYGKKDYFEFFAEVFANSQCGKPNELGDAMNEWLIKEGLIK
ncbi:MAG: minor capsid protein [Acetobacterium woodii]|nr:minor capsid protein [Acetobacterium woodii]